MGAGGPCHSAERLRGLLGVRTERFLFFMRCRTKGMPPSLCTLLTHVQIDVSPFYFPILILILEWSKIVSLAANPCGRDGIEPHIPHQSPTSLTVVFCPQILSHGSRLTLPCSSSDPILVEHSLHSFSLPHTEQSAFQAPAPETTNRIPSGCLGIPHHSVTECNAFRKHLD